MKDGGADENKRAYQVGMKKRMPVGIVAGCNLGELIYAVDRNDARVKSEKKNEGIKGADCEKNLKEQSSRGQTVPMNRPCESH